MAQFDGLRQHPFDQNVTAEIAVTGQTPPMVATENSKRLMRLLEEEGSLLGVDVKFVGAGGGSDASRVSSGEASPGVKGSTRTPYTCGPLRDGL